MDDLIKQLRDMMYRMSWDDAKKLGEIIAALDGSTLATSKANAALEAAKARITALESERDALLAAAGKEAVAWLVTAKRGLVRCAWTDKPSPDQLATCKFDGDTVTPLYTAPTAALHKIAAKLRQAGATLPVEVQGTIESSFKTGLSIALCLVEEALSQQKAGEQ
jgi:hypothetical protein